MATATGVYNTTYRKDLALRHTKAEYVRLALLAAFAVVLPFTLDQYWLSYANLILLAAIAAVGLNILTGLHRPRQPGHGRLLGVGAYTAANLTVRSTTGRCRWPCWPPRCWRRPSGPSSACRRCGSRGCTWPSPPSPPRTSSPTGSGTGSGSPGRHGNIFTSYPTLGRHQFRSDFEWYWILLVITGLVVFAGINLFRTGLGRSFIAIRDQDIAAEVMGVPVGRYKVLAFSIACGLAGLSGALQAHYRTIVTWENYEIAKSFIFVAMIIVGGLGSVSGAVYGAAFMTWVPAYITRIGQSLQTGSFSLPHRQATRRPADPVRPRPRRLPARSSPGASPGCGNGPRTISESGRSDTDRPRRNTMNRFARKLAIPLCFAMLVGVACGKDNKNAATKSTTTTKEDIKVGAIFDLSGPTADIGTPYSEGIRDYIDYKNA